MQDNDDPQEEDLRSPLAIGISWSVTLSGIAMQAVLPCLIGLWLDRRFGTGMLFFFVGLVLGMVSATVNLIKISKKRR